MIMEQIISFVSGTMAGKLISGLHLQDPNSSSNTSSTSGSMGSGNGISSTNSHEIVYLSLSFKSKYASS